MKPELVINHHLWSLLQCQTNIPYCNVSVSNFVMSTLHSYTCDVLGAHMFTLGYIMYYWLVHVLAGWTGCVSYREDSGRFQRWRYSTSRTTTSPPPPSQLTLPTWEVQWLYCCVCVCVIHCILYTHVTVCNVHLWWYMEMYVCVCWPFASCYVSGVCNQWVKSEKGKERGSDRERKEERRESERGGQRFCLIFVSFSLS